MAADGKAIVKRYEQMKADRHTYDERWERMAPYIAPSRVGITTRYYPGDKQTRGVYDSTTMMAAETMANFMAGNIFNPSQQWFGLEMLDPAVRESDRVREWLEEVRTVTMRRLAASMYYAEAPEMLIDYGGFGTGFLMIEEAPQPINRTIRGFRGFHVEAVKTGRFVIQDGTDGRVDTAYREFDLTARIIQARWKQGRMPDNVKAALASGNLDKPFCVIHCIAPRPMNEQTAGAQGMPWSSAWVEKESKEVIFESGYQTFPGAVPRYHRTPGEVFGRGRGDLAFPDTWTLNTAKRMGLEDWNLKIRPPLFMRHDSVIGSLQLVPAGPTSINTHGASIKDVIMPYQTGSHPEVSQIKEEELRRSIREIFFVDAIRQLMQFEDKSNTRTTREEFVRKLEILFRLLGPVYGRLEWEGLNRIIDVTFDLQMRAGALPPPPDEVFNSDGQIDVVFQNPISRAQRSGDAEALLLAVNDLAPLSERYPEMFDHIDPDKTALGVLGLRAVPARWTRDEGQVAEVRAVRAQEQQKDTQIARMEQMATAVGKLGPAAKIAQEGEAEGLAP